MPINLVHSKGHPANLKIRIVEISSMTPAGHTIINEQLNYDFESIVMTIRDIFTTMTTELSKLTKTVAH